MKKTVLVLFLILLFNINVFPGKENKLTVSSKKIYKLLEKMDNSTDDKRLAKLFEMGDENIDELIESLKVLNTKVQLNAQKVIRYLANEKGMKAVFESYKTNNQYSFVYPVPIPLNDWDYEFLDKNCLQTPVCDVDYAYATALILDNSKKSLQIYNSIRDRIAVSEQPLFKKILETQGDLVSQETNLEKLIEKQLIPSSELKCTTISLLAYSSKKDKALVELYINHGVLAEEWFNLVLKKTSNGWQIISLAQTAIS